VFFVLRTSEDSRVGKGEKLDHNTLRLIITIRTSTKGFSISSPPKRSRTMSRCFRVLNTPSAPVPWPEGFPNRTAHNVVAGLTGTEATD
jgi:hypothetical protein